MADNKNIIIGLLVLVVIILLAFLAFRPIMYSSTYGTGSYQPGHMGPGMMHNPAYNYSYGPGMMGDMMALYYPEAKPIAQEEARQKMEDFAKQYGSNLEVDDFMAFSSNYYAVLKDTGSNQSIAEILVDRYSGSVYPEPGPNMMWNTLSGAGRTKEEGADYDLAGAKKLTEEFLTGYLPGAKVMESKQMPGYYTFDFGRQDIEGMLSVNAYNGQIWVHTWHGPYLGEDNATN
ncbi:MAG: peptidase M4 [Methanosarcina sp.]|nr:peptidase M4 [Methanosarcina sp.]